jgi:hypothetical protein
MRAGLDARMDDFSMKSREAIGHGLRTGNYGVYTTKIPRRYRSSAGLDDSAVHMLHDGSHACHSAHSPNRPAPVVQVRDLRRVFAQPTPHSPGANQISATACPGNRARRNACIPHRRYKRPFSKEEHRYFVSGAASIFGNVRDHPADTGAFGMRCF